MPRTAFETTTYLSFDVSARQVLVQLDPGVSTAGLAEALQGLAHVEGTVGSGGLLALTLDTALPIQRILDIVSHLPGVRYAAPDYVIHTFDDEDGGGLGGSDGGSVHPPTGVDGSTDLGGSTGLGVGGGETDGIAGYDVSNDPGVTNGTTWGMYGDTTTRVNAFGSQAGEAWTANYTGSTKIAVGVVDTGVDYTHPDLYLNIWLNQGEIPLSFKASLTDSDGDGRITFRDLNNIANAAFVSDVNGNGRIDGGDLLNDSRWEDGADQDGNGLTDDLIGWDFINNDNDPMDDVGHGTHVAGIIAAQGGNGVGVAGVTWSTQIIVAKFLGPGGGLSSDAVTALDYVTQASKAAGSPDVVATNNSWGAPTTIQAVEDAVVRGAQAGILFVASAGNGGADQIGDSNNLTPNYPSNFDTTAGAGYDAVIAVASITSTGTLSSFSNYGSTTVDLGAPGSGIYSTALGGGYVTMSGTSMAAPFVTGAIALYAAAAPSATPAQIRADLLASTIATSSLAQTVTGGRLDVSSFVYRGSPGGVISTGSAAADVFSMTAAPVGQSKASVFNDSLIGADGADRLDGGPGADVLTGGPGNDTYTVETPGDLVVELPGEGTDLVNSTISWTLGPNLENLTLTGTAAVNGTGNELANALTGNAAANSLDGGAGNDVLNGGVGVDTLIGGMGNDRLTGGTGADSMLGGLGDDTYDVDDPADAVIEAAGDGNDLVNSGLPTYVLADNVERLTLTGTAPIGGTGNGLANTLTGNTAANLLDGAAGDDTLNGLAGADTLVGGLGNDKLVGGTEADSMAGGAGDDSYDVDNAGDVITELAGEGNDLVTSTAANYTLSPEIERLTLGGTAAINGTGNDQANTITGNTADNVLDGAGGTDTLTGGTGADTLLGGAGADKLIGGVGADRMVGGDGDDVFDVDVAGDVIVELAGEGDDLVTSLVTYTLSANVERLTLGGSVALDGTGNELGNTLTGNSGANRLFGLDGADTLNAGSGDDTLDGGVGADSLVGGSGNDVYVVDDPADTILEAAGAGNDVVNSSAATYVLADNLEKLTLTGTAGIGGTGNALANTITGNSGANLLDGGLGDDTLLGGAGTDSLVGGVGNDRLTGGTEADAMSGGVGNDTYDVDDPGDTVVELAGEGSDTVNSLAATYTLGANVENLVLGGSAAINGTGNDLGNIITGNAAANLIDGGAGNDTVNGGAGTDTLVGGIGNDRLTGGTEGDAMSGGLGDDTYDVDDAGDTAIEQAGEGNDLVNSTVSFTLGANVERLTLTGSAAINGTGNTLANTLTGNAAANGLDGDLGDDVLVGGAGGDTLVGGAGNDRLTGGTEADAMSGGIGDDTYDVDAAGDTVTELVGEGNDLINSTVTFTLSANVERLTLTGAAAIDGTGNELANLITGNTAANKLAGAGGNDTLTGGTGDDTLDGGLGADSLVGGTGNDRFYFEHGQAAGDMVSDFALGDHLEFHGYGAGSTLTKVVGSLTNWTITDGVTGATEVITLTNKYALVAGDYVFS